MEMVLGLEVPSRFREQSQMGGLLVDAHLLLNPVTLGAEASNCGALLALCRRSILSEAPRGLLLQLEGQVMEDACTVLHRLEERTGEEISTLKYLFSPV